METLRQLLIGIVLVSLIAWAFGSLISNYNEAYDVEMTGTKFNQTLNKMSNIRSSSEELKGNLSESSMTPTDFMSFTVTGAWKVIISMISIPKDIFMDSTMAIAEMTYLPMELVAAVITILTITIMFIIASAIFKRRI